MDMEMTNADLLDPLAVVNLELTPELEAILQRAILAYLAANDESELLDTL